MTTATVLSQGQITIPADVRHALQVNVGDKVEFVEIEPGTYQLVAATRPVAELKGMFGKAKRTVSVAEMNRAIAAQAAAIP